MRPSFKNEKAGCLDTAGDQTPRCVVHDVIVIGLGAMGTAAVFEAAATGARVMGLEQFAPAHDKGSSHGKTRMIRKAYLEGDFYIPLLQRAYDRWAELSQLTSQEIFNPCGVLYGARDDDPIIVHTQRSAHEYHIPLQHLSADEVVRRYPAFRPLPSYTYLFEPTGGYTHPESTLALYRALALEQGAELRFDTPVTRLDTSGRLIAVHTPKQSFTTHRVIITAGPWLATVTADMGWIPPLTVRRMALHWFEPEGGRENVQPDRFVPNIFRSSQGAFLYGFPWTRDEAGLKYAFHDRHNPAVDPLQPKRAVSTEETLEVAEAVAEVLAKPIRHLTTKTCLYSMTPDAHFLIGLLPDDRRIAVAGGFSGHGFKFTPVIGEILRDLALDGGSAHNLKSFALNRFQGGAV